MRGCFNVLFDRTHYFAPFSWPTRYRRQPVAMHERVVSFLIGVITGLAVYLYTQKATWALTGIAAFYLSAALFKSVKEKIFREITMIRIFQGNEQGIGICEESKQGLYDRLRAIFPKAEIGYFKTGENCDPSRWNDSDLVVFPGGSCSYWDSCFTEERRKKFRRWVQDEGGRILAVCAGAYFMAERSEYRPLQNEPIERSRQLAGFQYTCKGPIEQEAVAMELEFLPTAQKCHAAVIGGGRLESITPGDPNFVPLLCSDKGHTLAALVKDSEGAGWMLALSTHLELESENFAPPSSESYMIKGYSITKQQSYEMTTRLQKSKTLRDIWFAQMLDRLVKVS